MVLELCGQGAYRVDFPEKRKSTAKPKSKKCGGNAKNLEISHARVARSNKLAY